MKMRFSLAVVLGLALCAAVYAQDPNPAPPAGQQYGGGGHGQRAGRGYGGMGMMGRGVTGTVTAVAADHFTVNTFQGDTYTVKFSDNTRIMKMRGRRGARGMMSGGGMAGGRMGMGRGMRGNPPEQIKASEIKVGDAITARGNVESSAKTVDARAIMLLDPQMAERMKQMAADYGKTWLMGRVTEVKGTKVTLMGTQDNASHTFVVNENTDFRERRNPVTLADVKVGDMVRVEGSVVKGTFTAARVDVIRFRRGGPNGPGPRNQ